MTGKQIAAKLKEYQNALDIVSNETVEYVRGVLVVKTFGQTVFFKNSRPRLTNTKNDYTKDLRTPMMFYTVAVNSVFAFLIASANVDHIYVINHGRIEESGKHDDLCRV